MPIKIFLNKKNKLIDASDQFIPFATNGWWNKIIADDFDGDGKVDLIIANYGLNSPLQASEQEPVQLYASDIDGNGSIDPIMTHYNNHVAYPFFPMDDINQQVPSLRKKFYDYEVYANATIKDIIPAEALKSIHPLMANNFKTMYLKNTGKRFVAKELPIQAQYSPVYSINAVDINHDGYKDVILCGNNIYNKILLGRDDANHGLVLQNDGKGNFTYLPPAKSGLTIHGDVRSIENIGNYLFFGINNQPVKVYSINK